MGWGGGGYTCLSFTHLSPLPHVIREGMGWGGGGYTCPSFTHLPPLPLVIREGMGWGGGGYTYLSFTHLPPLPLVIRESMGWGGGGYTYLSFTHLPPLPLVIHLYCHSFLIKMTNQQRLKRTALILNNSTLAKFFGNKSHIHGKNRRHFAFICQFIYSPICLFIRL